MVIKTKKSLFSIFLIHFSLLLGFELCDYYIKNAEVCVSSVNTAFNSECITISETLLVGLDI